MIIVFVSALAAGFMTTLVAEEKTFKCCNKWNMSSDCHFQVMKCWFIFKETAFWCHVSPEFAAFRKKSRFSVITDKSEMRICPRKLKQFRRNLNTTVNCSDPLGSQKKVDSHLMKDDRKEFINVVSSTSTIEPFSLTWYTTYTFSSPKLMLMWLDAVFNETWRGFTCTSATPRCFVSLYTPVSIKTPSLSHMSELLQPWIILAISGGRANASWRGPHFSGERALSGIARYRLGGGIMCACALLPN